MFKCYIKPILWNVFNSYKCPVNFKYHCHFINEELKAHRDCVTCVLKRCSVVLGVKLKPTYSVLNPIYINMSFASPQNSHKEFS